MNQPVRFTQPFLDSLTIDETAILYYIYWKNTNRTLDFRIVKVVPMYEMLLTTEGLTQEGMLVLQSLFLKVANEFGLPTQGLDVPNQEPLFTDTVALSGTFTIYNNLETTMGDE